MRDQNFGIEIEMTGITRATAAKTIAGLLGTQATHVCGAYDAYTVEDPQGRKWKVVSDGSIHCEARGGREGTRNYSVEVVPPICKYEDIEGVQEIVRSLRHAGAKVNSTCGIHVHVDAARHTPQTLRNIVNIMASKEDLLYKALGVQVDREYYCQKADLRFLDDVNHIRPKSMQELNRVGLPGVSYQMENDIKCGIKGTHISVKIDGIEEEEHSHIHPHIHHDSHMDYSHKHTGMTEIRKLISTLAISDQVKADALDVYEKIAAAESAVHGVEVDQIHFHEVGSMDAIADVVAVSMLMEEISPEQVIVSPIHVGSGQVHCAHGILPVPAPATLQLLKGCPIYSGQIHGELCTPTGAALLSKFATRWGGIPLMTVEKIGYGMGKKNFPAVNCVRILSGELK